MMKTTNFALSLLPGRTRVRLRSGWTLVEMMIAVGAGAMIMATVLAVAIFVLANFKSIGNYADLNSSSRQTLDLMSRDIRNAASVIGYATNYISLTNNDTTTFQYFWDPSRAALYRYYTNKDTSVTTTVMLTNCNILSFAIYKRVPFTNFTFTTTTIPAGDTKLVDVSWRCFRTIYGNPLNSESVQTARIVIRN